MEILRVEHLSKIYGSGENAVKAVDDVSFSVEQGEFVAIIGHGVVPVAQCLRLLKNAGYNGYFTVEFEGMKDPRTGVACGLNTLKKIESLL